MAETAVDPHDPQNPDPYASQLIGGLEGAPAVQSIEQPTGKREVTPVPRGVLIEGPPPDFGAFTDLVPRQRPPIGGIDFGAFSDLVPRGEETSTTEAQKALDETQLMDFGPKAVTEARARLGNVPKTAGQVETEIAAAQTVSPIPPQALPPYWYAKALRAGFPESKVAQIAAGVLQGEAELGSSLATPENVSLAVGLAPVAGSKLAQTAVAGLFLGQQIKGTPEQWREIKDAYDRGDLFTVAKTGTAMGAGYAFPTLMLGHVAKEGIKGKAEAPIGPLREEQLSKEAPPTPEVVPSPSETALEQPRTQDQIRTGQPAERIESPRAEGTPEYARVQEEVPAQPKEGETNASEITEPESVPVQPLREGVGEEAPLRQPGETATTRPEEGVSGAGTPEQAAEAPVEPWRMAQDEYVASQKPEVPGDVKVYQSLYRQSVHEAIDNLELSPNEARQKIGDSPSIDMIERVLRSDEREHPGLERHRIERKLSDGEYVSPEVIAKYPDLIKQPEPSKQTGINKPATPELTDNAGNVRYRKVEGKWRGAKSDVEITDPEVVRRLDEDYRKQAEKPVSSEGPERIAQSAWRFPDGQIIETGFWHDPNSVSRDLKGAEAGFVTTSGRFVGRDEAGRIATGKDIPLAAEDFVTGRDIRGEHPITALESGASSGAVKRASQGTPKGALTDEPMVRMQQRPAIRSGTGTTGIAPSKIGKSIEAKAVEAKLTEGFAETAGYDPITIQDQAHRATSFIKSSPTEARAVIRGEAPLPEGLRGTSLITAMEENLLRNPDVQVAYELANSPLTSATSVAAQEMRLMAERVPDSLVAKFQEIRAARQAGSQVRGETPQRIFQDITKEIVKQSSKRPTWEAFVRSIECV